jgi:hypothetical protein
MLNEIRVVPDLVTFWAREETSESLDRGALPLRSEMHFLCGWRFSGFGFGAAQAAAGAEP